MSARADPSPGFWSEAFALRGSVTLRVLPTVLLFGWLATLISLLQWLTAADISIEVGPHEIAGFVEVNPEGGKVSRAAAASPQLESGNWYLPHPMVAPWVEQFIAECAAFPNGAFDDQVDSWSQGAKRLLTFTAKRAATRVIPERIYHGDRSWMF